VYLTNSSVLRYIFGLTTNEVILIYGISAFFGISVYLLILRLGISENIKKNIYLATIIEFVCLILMYYFSIHLHTYAFIALFIIHNLITPYIMFNLDSLFEAYTNIKDRGRGRGIYLTMWNIPFVIVPLIISALSVTKLPIVYITSSFLLIPFLYIIFHSIKNPDPSDLQILASKHDTVFEQLKAFFRDSLDRKAFIAQSILRLYYGIITVLLPIYLHSIFLFDWDKIGLILAAMTAPFVLIQIPFGNMEDAQHNEKGLFKIGLAITCIFTIMTLFISPAMEQNTSFLLISASLFFAHIGCSLIEISTESMFYKHVTERDYTALLMFRMARILPYCLGILALFFI
ncbi:MFS transporter, partial [Candidatus Parcubacteria bacterium]|nr:MFS transporter [Candidatus Parcubacteria bacterium]